MFHHQIPCEMSGRPVAMRGRGIVKKGQGLLIRRHVLLAQGQGLSRGRPRLMRGMQSLSRGRQPPLIQQIYMAVQSSTTSSTRTVGEHPGDHFQPALHRHSIARGRTVFPASYKRYPRLVQGTFHADYQYTPKENKIPLLGHGSQIHLFNKRKSTDAVSCSKETIAQIQNMDNVSVNQNQNKTSPCDSQLEENTNNSATDLEEDDINAVRIPQKKDARVVCIQKKHKRSSGTTDDGETYRNVFDNFTHKTKTCTVNVTEEKEFHCPSSTIQTNTSDVAWKTNTQTASIAKTTNRNVTKKNNSSIISNDQTSINDTRMTHKYNMGPIKTPRVDEKTQSYSLNSEKDNGYNFRTLSQRWPVSTEDMTHKANDKHLVGTTYCDVVQSKDEQSPKIELSLSDNFRNKAWLSTDQNPNSLRNEQIGEFTDKRNVYKLHGVTKEFTTATLKGKMVNNTYYAPHFVSRQFVHNHNVGEGMFEGYAKNPFSDSAKVSVRKTPKEQSKTKSSSEKSIYQTNQTAVERGFEEKAFSTAKNKTDKLSKVQHFSQAKNDWHESSSYDQSNWDMKKNKLQESLLGSHYQDPGYRSSYFQHRRANLHNSSTVVDGRWKTRREPSHPPSHLFNSSVSTSSRQRYEDDGSHSSQSGDPSKYYWSCSQRRKNPTLLEREHFHSYRSHNEGYLDHASYQQEYDSEHHSVYDNGYEDEYYTSKQEYRWESDHPVTKKSWYRRHQNNEPPYRHAASVPEKRHSAYLCHSRLVSRMSSDNTDVRSSSASTNSQAATVKSERHTKSVEIAQCKTESEHVHRDFIKVPEGTSKDSSKTKSDLKTKLGCSVCLEHLFEEDDDVESHSSLSATSVHTEADSYLNREISTRPENTVELYNSLNSGHLHHLFEEDYDLESHSSLSATSVHAEADSYVNRKISTRPENMIELHHSLNSVRLRHLQLTESNKVNSRSHLPEPLTESKMRMIKNHCKLIILKVLSYLFMILDTLPGLLKTHTYLQNISVKLRH